MSEDNTKIPKGVLDEARAMINSAAEDTVLQYAKKRGIKLKGFRLSKESVPAIKKRLAGTVRAGRKIDSSLSELADETHLCFSLLAVVSDKLVEFFIEDMLAVCGKDELLAAMLLAPSSDLHEMAEEYITNEYDHELPDQSEARSRLVEMLSPFFDLSQDWVAAVAADDEEGEEGAKTRPARKASPEQEERIVELEKLLKKQETESQRELNKQRKRLAEVNEKQQKLAREVKDLTKKISEEQKKRKDVKTALNRACEEYTALEEKSAAAILKGIEDGLNSAVNCWIKPLIERESRADEVRASAKDDKLIASAEQALNEQAERDRHSGNMSILRKRLSRLRDLLARVTRARSEALHPLPELKLIEGDLRNEVNQLQGIVGLSGGGNKFLEKMAVRINEAPTADALTEIKNVVDRMHEVGAIDAAELQRLYESYNRRMSLLYAAFTPKVTKKEQYPDDPVWRMKQAVDRNADLIIILDGHNILHLLQSIFEDDYEDGVPHMLARQKLVRMMVGIFSGSPRCRAEVVFDGPKFSQQNHGANVREVYSGGGKGEHRADNYIIEYLEHCCREMSAMPRILVSDDRDLRSKAAEFGATYMPVPQFGAFLQEMQQ